MQKLFQQVCHKCLGALAERRESEICSIVSPRAAVPEVIHYEASSRADRKGIPVALNFASTWHSSFLSWPRLSIEICILCGVSCLRAQWPDFRRSFQLLEVLSRDSSGYRGVQAVLLLRTRKALWGEGTVSSMLNAPVFHCLQNGWGLWKSGFEGAEKKDVTWNFLEITNKDVSKSSDRFVMVLPPSGFINFRLWRRLLWAATHGPMFAGTKLRECNWRDSMQRKHATRITRADAPMEMLPKKPWLAEQGDASRTWRFMASYSALNLEVIRSVFALFTFVPQKPVVHAEFKITFTRSGVFRG